MLVKGLGKPEPSSFEAGPDGSLQSLKSEVICVVALYMML